MDNSVILAILTIIGSVLGSVFGVWALTRKNRSEVEKARGLSEVTARNAETKERADLLEMIKESSKQSVAWLEALKITEHKREMDYSTLKAIIEDGTQETINSRKELLKNVDSVASQAREHNTGITNSLDEVKRELGSLRMVVEKLPGQNDEMKSRIDITLGYIERLLPKLRSTNEMIAATNSNSSLPETTPSTS
jgi:chromosome segregation ATPase